MSDEQEATTLITDKHADRGQEQQFLPDELTKPPDVVGHGHEKTLGETEMAQWRDSFGHPAHRARCPCAFEPFAARAGTLEGVFERFTDRARKVLTLAQEEARLLNHSFIGTEHLLLGLIHEGDGVGAQALRSLGISLEAVREKVEETIGMAGTAPSGSPPFTPRAKKVLELSLREALQLNHNYIGTEHILLGLVREGEGVAATVLISLGAEPGRVRREVIRLMSGEGEPLASGTPNEGHGAARGRLEATGPLRPRCRASVSLEARFRTIEVTSDAGNPDPIPVHVVYCMQCGTTLHMFRATGTS